jgi:hypothetical protein
MFKSRALFQEAERFLLLSGVHVSDASLRPALEGLVDLDARVAAGRRRIRGASAAHMPIFIWRMPMPPSLPTPTPPHTTHLLRCAGARVAAVVHTALWRDLEAGSHAMAPRRWPYMLGVRMAPAHLQPSILCMHVKGSSEGIEAAMHNLELHGA